MPRRRRYRERDPLSRESFPYRTAGVENSIYQSHVSPGSAAAQQAAQQEIYNQAAQIEAGQPLQSAQVIDNPFVEGDASAKVMVATPQGTQEIDPTVARIAAAEQQRNQDQGGGLSISDDSTSRLLYSLSGEQRGPQTAAEHQAMGLARQPDPRVAAGYDNLSTIQSQLLGDQVNSPAQQVAAATGGPMGTAMADAMAPRNKARSLKAAQALAEIGERMYTATDSQKAGMMQQYNQQYPEYAQLGIGPAPLTSEQAAQLQMQVREQQMNHSAQQIMSGQMPDQLLFSDGQGGFKIPDGLQDLHRMTVSAKQTQLNAQAEQAKLEFDQQREFRKGELDALDAQIDLIATTEKYLPELGEDATPEQKAQRQQRYDMLDRERASLVFEKTQLFRKQGRYGQQPEQPQQTASPQDYGPGSEQYDQAQQVAEDRGLPLVVDEGDFEVLEPGQEFIDASDGQSYTKPSA